MEGWLPVKPQVEHWLMLLPQLSHKLGIGRPVLGHIIPACNLWSVPATVASLEHIEGPPHLCRCRHRAGWTVQQACFGLHRASSCLQRCHIGGKTHMQLPHRGGEEGIVKHVPCRTLAIRGSPVVGRA